MYDLTIELINNPSLNFYNLKHSDIESLTKMLDNSLKYITIYDNDIKTEIYIMKNNIVTIKIKDKIGD